jgi:predicted AlkP superfamily phosphohydrolase/phosphomutase
MLRKIIILLILIVLVVVGYKYFTHPHYAKLNQKIVVLGFDGMDPTLTEKFMAEGKLPNLAALSKEGTYSRLSTTNPAESPVSWASFITGSNPGKHGIFDFLTRDPKTYMPDLALVTPVFPKSFFPFGKYKIPLEKPQAINNRHGIPIWDVTKKYNIHTMALHVPDTFPAEELAGEMLSGLGVPDTRGTWGTFTYYSDQVDDANSEFGGKIIKVTIEKDNTIHTYIFGPRDRFLKQPIDSVHVPVTIHLNRANKTIAITIQGQTQTLKVGDWSNWYSINFNLAPFVNIHGIGRFCFIDMGPEFKLYFSPVNFDPRNPPFPIAYPASFGKKLVKKMGIYQTLGWTEDTWALTEDRISEDLFIQDVNYTFDEREKQTLMMLKKYKDLNLFMMVSEATDRMQHTFWRYIDPKHPMYTAEGAKQYGDAILHIYQRADAMVGKVRKEVDPNTTIIVLSDHGFHSWRYAVNLNTWLVKNGFMTLVPEEGGDKESLDKLFGHGNFFENVDWSQTRAYCVGLGKIYINEIGREGQGIVAPGKEYEDTRNEIIAKLKQLRNPLANNEPVVMNVYKKNEIYTGPYVDKAGDLLVGFYDGYRVSWQTALGGTPPDVIELNKRKWSADHCSIDPTITSGVIFSNKKLNRTNPAIIDVAPSIIHLLGVPQPKEWDGNTFFD